MNEAKLVERLTLENILREITYSTSISDLDTGAGGIVDGISIADIRDIIYGKIKAIGDPLAG